MSGRMAAAAVAIILIVAVAGVYLAGRGGEGKPELVIYVYDGFMAYGENPEEVWAKVFDSFGEKYDVEVKVRVFDSAREALLTAIDEYRKGVRTADLIIGVDNLLIYEAKKAGIVECYYSPVAEESVSEAIALSLDPEKCVTPIDYGLIAIVYDPTRLPEEVLDILRAPSLDDLARPEVASRLIVEDPTKSSTGLNFLFWQIAVYQGLEGKDWRDWWRSIADKAYIAPSWSDAYDVFLSGGERAIVVSYGTDTAYSAWYNKGAPTFNATLIYYNGKATGWLQVEGALVVKGQPGTEWAKKFVDWLLSPEVQSLIPDNQWMLPANSQVQLPDYYKYALTLEDVDLIANSVLPTDIIEERYEQWLLEWTQIAAGG